MTMGMTSIAWWEQRPIEQRPYRLPTIAVWDLPIGYNKPSDGAMAWPIISFPTPEPLPYIPTFGKAAAFRDWQR